MSTAYQEWLVSDDDINEGFAEVTRADGQGDSSTVQSTISSTLISHVRMIYELALYELASRDITTPDRRLGPNVQRKGINGFSSSALPAYIVAVAAVEAFINELTFGFARVSFEDSPLWDLPPDWLEEGVNLRAKLVLIPQLLFGQTFSRNTQPYQDMALLIKVRNHLVHYKMQGNPPKYLKHLDERGISLTPQFSDSGVDYAWPVKLSTCEGVRWAHNTACDTVRAMTTFIPTAAREYRQIINLLANSFSPIPDSYAREWLIAHQIDPDG